MESDTGSAEEQVAPLVSGVPSAAQQEALANFRTGSAELDLLAMEARLKWIRQARPQQLVPQVDWNTWVLLTGRGFGKALELSTPVPTNRGMKFIKDVVAGDKLIGSDGCQIEVLVAHEPYVPDALYRVTFDDGSFVDADANHLWTTHTKLNRKNYNRNNKKMVETVVTTEQIKNSLLYKGREANHAIPVVRMRGSYRSLPLHPYFLGAWLGDGMTHEAAIICGENDELIFDRLQQLGYEIQSVRWTIPRSANGKPWPICSFKNVHKHLRDLSILGRKRIPFAYLQSTIEQRFELLRGLMDTDGSVNKATGVCELSLSNEDLARDAYQLICSLGFKASMKPYASWRYLNGSKYNQGKDRWRICFYAYDDEPIFHLPYKKSRLLKRKGQNQLQSYRYIKSVTKVKSVPVRCLTVDAPDALYCVTPSFVLTHNTKSGCEEVWWQGIENPQWRIAVIAPTNDDVRYTCFEGESGIISCCPPKLVSSYNRSLLTIDLINGTQIRGFSSEKPDRLRGPQHHLCYCDELSSWQNPDDTWAMMKFGLRLGKAPRKIITTTPKPIPLIREIVGDPTATIVRGTTYDNKENLPQKFFEDIAQYEGTSLGRQELYGEIVDLEELGIFKRSWFKLWPLTKPYPVCELVVQSYDTAFSEKTAADFTVCTTWGLFPVREGSKGYAAILWDAWAEQMPYPTLRSKAIKEYNTKFGRNERRPDIVLIEAKGSGQSLIQDLRSAGIPVRSYNPGRADKLQRANIVSHLVKDGLIYIPESRQKGREGKFMTWAEEMIEQLVYFPNTKNDDYVDSLTQFLMLMKDAGWMTSEKAHEDETSYWRKLQKQQRGKQGVYG